MAFRVWRRMQLFPGVRLNLSGRGVSLSVGPRGASFTFGSRGAYANLGIPGSGLSYRTRLSVPPSPKGLLRDFGGGAAPRSSEVSRGGPTESTPARTQEDALRNLLRDREKGIVDWAHRASWLSDPRPNDDEGEAFEKYTYKISAARFAKRMVEGDKAAWAEVIREELRNEQLPFGFSFEWGIDDVTGIVRVEVELPDKSILAGSELTITKRRELYEDVCCALVLRFAHEVFRVVPAVTDVYISGYMPSRSAATGHAARDVYLRLMVGRDTFLNVDLDYADPSAAFEGLGGSKRMRRGELIPIAVEERPTLSSPTLTNSE